ncbi:hypothetical protein SHJG_p239 (plasmid) [Streptomyces hygroscopicus subsp. jinggangensis 5008]|nr:hypothetical protein SHJG_p239 [Streptomyces hygroscopicus subsp. jinggangensis 5008]AGF68508.1 hypothetical protein SHJGH_p239 [Streptomyces hygroscopicus subsp. jinggangensis TL01]
MHLTPPCPQCSTATERIEVEGEEVWRCTAPGCTRRTYGTSDPDDDDTLPGYSEVDEDGAEIVYHGTGEIDVEATAELAAQGGPGDDDLVEEEWPAPAADAGPPGDAPGVGHVPSRGRGSTRADRGRHPDVEVSPDAGVPAPAITDSNGAVGREPQRPHDRVGHEPPSPFPGPSPREHG